MTQVNVKTGVARKIQRISLSPPPSDAPPMARLVSAGVEEVPGEEKYMFHGTSLASGMKIVWCCIIILA